ncbi:MAG: cytochrome c biogenesis protein CcsA [Gemmatimonadaceae bacterium]|nr:cytochrome c biogenesis protein CcsA [Gemmatimonadaceae bacterium]
MRALHTRTSRKRMKFSWLSATAAVAVGLTVVRVVAFTPIEAVQGPAQKIYYIHVPAAWVAFLAFFLVAIASAVYLWLRDIRLDRFAESSAEVGVVFTTVVLTTGPLWGKPIWGTYWTWDARLTSTLFLWFIYVGYIVLRGAVDDPSLRARYSAVLGILGAFLIPFIHMSVYMFRTLHPMPILGQPAALARDTNPALPSEMRNTMLLALLSFTLLYAAFLSARYKLATARGIAEAEVRDA